MPTQILYCFDEGFVECSLVSALSVIQNTKPDYKIFLIHNELSEYSLAKVWSFAEKFKDRITVKQFCDNLPAVKGSHITNFALARLVTIMDFKGRVLYIDGDTLACSDMSELLDLELNGLALGAAVCPTHLSWWYKSLSKFRPGWSRNLAQVNRRLSELKLKSLNSYVNSGVMLIDTDVIRNLGLAAAFSDVEKASKFRWHDQDYINVLLRDHIKLIDSKYNSIWGNLSFRSLVYPKWLRISQHEAIENPIIVHFAGKQKPWRDDKQRLGIKLRRNITRRSEKLFVTAWRNKKKELDELLSG